MKICKMCGADLISIGQMCFNCKKEAYQKNREINHLISLGHPHPCAVRQIWGDGECECLLYKQGYKPYAWLDAPAVKEK